MSRLIKPVLQAGASLNDPRSTGARNRPPLRDILGLKGTKPS